MAILTYSGRTFLAQSLLTHPIYLAIGKGKSSWETSPETPEYEDTELLNVVGYKKLTRSLFVNEDAHGEIRMPVKRFYSVSETPTREVYLEFQFEYDDVEELADVDIWEVGVFADTVPVSGLPSTQTYFTPSQIANKGMLITLEHLDKADSFTPSRAGLYKTVLTI